MSTSFRAVKETWYESSSLFVDRDIFCVLVDHVCDVVRSQWQSNEYGEVMSVWIEEGQRFLDYIRNNEDFTAVVVGDVITGHGFSYEAEDLDNLITNMRNTSGLWRQAIDTDGSLRFYVD